ncbi:MAG: hypothetical protein KY476_16780 [Planctomycetes bacterium]|nr:hypothetical protein [Planctomycetota bacterium]
MDEFVALIRQELHLSLPLEAHTPLISSGLIDSFQVVSLLVALEAAYGVRVDPADIGVDNFDTLAQMHRWVEREQRAA